MLQKTKDIKVKKCSSLLNKNKHCWLLYYALALDLITKSCINEDYIKLIWLRFGSTDKQWFYLMWISSYCIARLFHHITTVCELYLNRFSQPSTVVVTRQCQDWIQLPAKTIIKLSLIWSINMYYSPCYVSITISHIYVKICLFVIAYALWMFQRFCLFKIRNHRMQHCLAFHL